MNTVLIRHYLPADQLALLELSADTAFFGEPVEAFLDDRRLYNDAFARYYTEFEASLAWVADDTHGVVGFLLGCIDTSPQSKRWQRYILSKVVIKVITRKYSIHKKTAMFAFGMLVGTIRGEEAQVDLATYPAHLQIDVKKGFRGEGVGRRLIDAYLSQLRELKIIGIHLETTSHNKAACHLYEKVGFQLLDERINRFWTHLLGYEVKNRSYGMKLD
jgi:ribosomal protein S18 acetylase RimI-like enzyme